MSTINASGTLYLRSGGATQVEYSTDNTNWTSLASWPLTINNSAAASSTYLQILFTTNITLSSSANQYFICGTNYIQFGSSSLNSDGTNPTITIQNIANYPGLVRNGLSSTNGRNYIRIYNLNITASGTSSLASNGGWIGQRYFSRGANNNYVINCSNSGNISSYGGGIIGDSAALNSGASLTVINCHNSGNMTSYAGGIIGGNVGYTVIVLQCSNSGSIGQYGGGIIAASDPSEANLNTLTIMNCYNTGVFTSNLAGGICGYYMAVWTGNVNISNCYSTSPIGVNCGGICAPNAYDITGVVTATNCYSTGAINASGGGIFAQYNGAFNKAINCYTSGARLGASGGIFGGSSSDNPAGSSNNFSEGNNSSSGWKDSKAIITLTGVPTGGNPLGTSWITTALNTPYILREKGFSPYSINNITASNSLNTSYIASVIVGQSTIAAILPAGYTYTIRAINNSSPSSFSSISINSSTGQISTSASTTAGSYTIVLQNNQLTYYSISVFNLTVTSPPPVPAPPPQQPVPAPPISDPNVPNANAQNSNFNADVITHKKSGRVLFGAVDNFYAGVASGGRTANSQPIFKSNYDYINYLQGRFR